MGLLVEARQLSAMGPDGLIFTSVSGVVHDRDLAVVSGPADQERTALMLALCGRLSLAGGTLHTDSSFPGRSTAAVLRDRIAVAQAPPVITVDPLLRVREAITERRLVCGKRMSVAAVRDACELMRIETPPGDTPIRDLDPVERLLLSVALACSQHVDGIAVADVDAGLGTADRLFVRRALRAISSAGKAVIATSSDAGWGDVDIPVSSEGAPDRGGEHGSTWVPASHRLPGYDASPEGKPHAADQAPWDEEDEEYDDPRGPYEDEESAS
ncbi:hypothetical protein ACIP6P_12280 [Streptomyces sp. NPDC088729]|uniref:hypothetical protein n=1 Tax=Streptomyces sp. NPDC088729 TaxID=3365876 RepID=UPI0038240BA0